jgi:hypothetical protein
MPRFKVLLVRDMQNSEEATAVVEAASEEQAKRIALQDVDWNTLQWKSRHDFASETTVEKVEAALDDEDLSELFKL